MEMHETDMLKTTTEEEICNIPVFLYRKVMYDNAVLQIKSSFRELYDSKLLPIVSLRHCLSYIICSHNDAVRLNTRNEMCTHISD